MIGKQEKTATKIIHCADLHLDSKLHTNLDRERAKKRRDELLHNFERLAAYASDENVEAVLIAGDLFDRETVSALAKNTVLSVIRSHPAIRFYYLKGNHDTAGFPDGPSNLFLFGNRWKTWSEGRDGGIAVSGIELTGENGASAHSSLRLDPRAFNIVMMHGQITGEGSGFRADSERRSFPGAASEAQAGPGAGIIDLRALRGRGIDYLALGHIHAGREGRLDERGIYCYPGCLEGRGFDEPGRHGFVLLEIDEKTHAMKRSFIPFARRTVHSLTVDVSGCRTTAGMKELVDDALRRAGCGRQDMAEIVLKGEIDVECEKDTGYILESLLGRLFFARLKDATVLCIDPEEYLYDESLRGEFVRLVMADPSISEEEKTAVIRSGFLAMDGEDPYGG